MIVTFLKWTGSACFILSVVVLAGLVEGAIPSEVHEEALFFVRDVGLFGVFSLTLARYLFWRRQVALLIYQMKEQESGVHDVLL